MTPFRFSRCGPGYGREHDDRSYRYLEETTEDIVRASIDATGFAWGSAAAAVRPLRDGTAKGFDEEVLDEIGEQVSLRQFDISDRDRDRVRRSCR